MVQLSIWREMQQITCQLSGFFCKQFLLRIYFVFKKNVYHVGSLTREKRDNKKSLTNKVG